MNDSHTYRFYRFVFISISVSTGEDSSRFLLPYSSEVNETFTITGYSKKNETPDTI